MKIETYEPCTSSEEVLKVMLIPTTVTGRTGVDLVVVNEKGKTISSGFLLNLSSNGVYLYSSINQFFGLPLDEISRVDIVEI